MKSLHRPDLFCWSRFNSERNVDFNGYFWKCKSGNIAFDPVPFGNHDAAHMKALGGVTGIIISNVDHIRDAQKLADQWNAWIGAPVQEKELPEFAGVSVSRWLHDGQKLRNGIRVLHMKGSKTPGELAFQLPPGDTLICGDLIRGQRGGHLNALPFSKLGNPIDAAKTIRRLADMSKIKHVLVGDGQSIFRYGSEALQELAEVALNDIELEGDITESL